MVGEIFAFVPEAGDDCGEVVVKFAACGEIRDDFFVFEISIFESLKGLLAVFGGSVASAGACEGSVGFF